MNNSEQFVVILTTTPNREVSLKIAQGLVKERLAACVNIVPNLTSIYLWKGKIEKDSEELLIIKSKASLIPKVMDYIRRNHPYETPEIIALPIIHGYEGYLKWLDLTLKST